MLLFILFIFGMRQICVICLSKLFSLHNILSLIFLACYGLKSKWERLVWTMHCNDIYALNVGILFLPCLVSCARPAAFRAFHVLLMTLGPRCFPPSPRLGEHLLASHLPTHPPTSFCIGCLFCCAPCSASPLVRSLAFPAASFHSCLAQGRRRRVLCWWLWRVGLDNVLGCFFPITHIFAESKAVKILVQCMLRRS